MANGHGGPRTPAHPAPVSGPGKYSQRTDGGPAQVMSTAPDQPYGDAGQEMQAQRVQPMAGTAPLPPSANVPAGGGAAPQGMQMPQYQGPGLLDPSNRPDEPVTAGAAIGPGPGPEALTMSPAAPPTPSTSGNGAMTSLLSRLSATDSTGALGQLMQMAQAHGA